MLGCVPPVVLTLTQAYMQRPRGQLPALANAGAIGDEEGLVPIHVSHSSEAHGLHLRRRQRRRRGERCVEVGRVAGRPTERERGRLDQRRRVFRAGERGVVRTEEPFRLGDRSVATQIGVMLGRRGGGRRRRVRVIR